MNICQLTMAFQVKGKNDKIKKEQIKQKIIKKKAKRHDGGLNIKGKMTKKDTMAAGIKTENKRIKK